MCAFSLGNYEDGEGAPLEGAAAARQAQTLEVSPAETVRVPREVQGMSVVSSKALWLNDVSAVLDAEQGSFTGDCRLYIH